MTEKRKIRFFRQHSLETCGISCILMVLDYYKKVEYPTARQERRLYALYRCRAFKGTLAPAIAECLSKNALAVQIWHSSEDYLDNRDGYYPEPLYRAILDEYKNTVLRIGDRVQIETGCVFSPDWYRERLDRGKLLIVQCVVPGDADGMHDRTLHWILIYGRRDGEFLACDPLSSKITLTEEELKMYTDTPVGSVCVVIGDEEPPVTQTSI